jgi:hypothetical protein
VEHGIAQEFQQPAIPRGTAATGTEGEKHHGN